MEYLTTYQLDWLSATDFYDQEGLFNLNDTPVNWLKTVGGMGYNTAYREELTGALMYRNDLRRDMGTLYNLSGKPLTLLLNFFPHTHRHECAIACGMKGLRSSRVDLAIDYYDEGALAHKFAAAAEDGLIKTPARKMHVFRELSGGSGITTYIGGGNSPRRLRVYDKCAESNGIISSTRIELQLRNQYSNSVWVNIQANPDYSSFTSLCNSLIGDFARCEAIREYMDILANRTEVNIPKRHTAETPKLKWLIRQVLGTFKEDFATHGRHALLEDFVQAIESVTGKSFRPR